MDIVEHPQVADGARVTSGISSLGVVVQSQELSLGWIIANPKLGLFPRRGDVEVALRYGDFLGGVVEHKALPLKKQRECMKNGVFRVSNATTLSWVSCLFVV